MRRLALIAAFLVASAARAVVVDVTISCTPTETGGIGSDNWPVTWHTDSGGQSRQFLAWGDGGGFTVNNETDNGNRLCRADNGFARITGTFASHTFADVAGCRTAAGPACENESGTYTSTCTSGVANQASFAGKVYGLLSLDHDGNGTTSLFAWNWVDGFYLQRSQLYESIDDGATWSIVSGVAFSESPASNFSNPTFIQYGKAYSLNMDGYVYIYSPEAGASGFNSVDRVYLARVPKASIKSKAAYQYYSGTNPSSPTWTSTYANAQPVFWYDENANSVPDADKIGWTVSVNYNPRLNTYFLYNNSAPNPTQDPSADTTLDVWHSPTPWGPWTLLKRFPSFCATTLADDYLFSFFTFPAWDSTVDGEFKLSITGTGSNDRYAVFAGSYVEAMDYTHQKDNHVYLNSAGGGNQLNDCPNPAHNVKGIAGNKDELTYCAGGSAAVEGRVIGTVAGTVTSTQCTDGGGTPAPVVNGSQVDIDRDGKAEKVYGSPQACVYDMHTSDSCEVHAGTYYKPGAQCGANCGDFSVGGGSLGECRDWNCWLGSVAAMGFGPNLNGVDGYGTEAEPGYLRGAVMNGVIDSWDTNLDKVPDGSYAAILSGNVDGGTLPDFDATSCSGASDCTGDSFRAVVVGCGGSYANTSGKILCSLTPVSGEEWVKIDADANGSFETSLDAVNGLPAHAPGVGTRPVDHLIIKDLEFRDYNQGTTVVDSGGRGMEANIVLNGDGAADGLKLDRIYLHDNAYGVSSSIDDESYQAHIADMQNRGCATYTEVMNSYLEQNNRLLFADEGSPHPSLGCSWRIHDNRILVNVKGYNASATPAIGFFKSIDYHQNDFRAKTIRFYNNEVIYKQASTGSTSIVFGFQFGQFGTSPDTDPGNGSQDSEPGLGKGEFWLYGNIFRVHSSPGPLMQRFFPSTCDIDCSPNCSTSWKFLYFNNTWDAWSSSTTVELAGLFYDKDGAVGELFVGRNNVETFTTKEPRSGMVDPPNASELRYGFNADTDSLRCSSYFTCGTDPGTGSGLAYYTPRVAGGLVGQGSCDPDGDGQPGFDTDGDGVTNTSWTDIAGNFVSCPTTGTALEIGAIQLTSCANTGCGDWCVGGAETCDDGNTSVEACVYGFPTVQVCDSDCIGTVNCSGPTFCGDGVINGPEACDGSALGGASCSSLGLGSGTLTCSGACAFNTSGCSTPAPTVHGTQGGGILGGGLP